MTFPTPEESRIFADAYNADAREGGDDPTEAGLRALGLSIFERERTAHRDGFAAAFLDGWVEGLAWAASVARNSTRPHGGYWANVLDEWSEGARKRGPLAIPSAGEVNVIREKATEAG